MKRLLPILIVLLFASSAHAFTLNVPEATINVPTLGSVDWLIEVSSNTAETITLNLIDLNTWTSLSDNAVVLSPGDTKDVVMTISPFRDTKQGLYKIRLAAESLATRQKDIKDIYINVFKGEIIAIERVTVSGNPTPTNELLLNISVKNYKTVPSNELRLVATVYSPSKPVFSFMQNIENINPNDQVNVLRRFTLEKYAEAGTYMVIANLTNGTAANGTLQTFRVNQVDIPVTTERKTALLFGYEKTFTITNLGNMPSSSISINDQISPVDGVFFSGVMPTAVLGENYRWTFRDVSPGEIIVVSYKIDYLPLLIFIIAVIVAIWIVFIKLRTVRIKKYIMQKKELQEGEEFTVGIEIKNASGRKIGETVIKDLVPPVFEIKEAQKPAPEKKKTAAGTELTWNLKDVHKKEERLVSYKIVPIFGVRGQIRLPRAAVIYKHKDREFENKSLYALIGINTEKETIIKKKKGK